MHLASWIKFGPAKPADLIADAPNASFEVTSYRTINPFTVESSDMVNRLFNGRPTTRLTFSTEPNTTRSPTQDDALILEAPDHVSPLLTE